MTRKLRGPMADWDVSAMLLRNLELGVRGLQWQNSGGKGNRPQPIPLPDGAGRDGVAPAKLSGADLARRMKDLGHIPADVNVD